MGNKEIQMQFEYLLSFRFSYLPGMRSKKFKNSTGTMKLKCPNTLEDLRTAPPESALSVGVVKLIHKEIKPKVKGRITGIIITDVKYA